jgi:hypothetical protein
MSGLRTRPSSLGIAVVSSLMLAMAAGVSLSELRSDVTPLDRFEAQKVVGGTTSCNSGYYIYELDSNGCGQGDCSKLRNAFYNPTGSGPATLLSKYCNDGTGEPCGLVTAAFPVCTVGSN